ncbi:MAG: hypothetical protein J1F42_04970 [Lachnospiraceae bacterium]|nr:hypothetical protein [Lachnospiraceae bacterium]
MTYRRTWFSWVLWLLFAVLCIILLVVDGIVWMQYFTSLKGTLLLMGGLSVIPAAACIYWIIRGVAVRIRKKCVWKERTVRIAVCVFFLIVLVLGLGLRAGRLHDFISIWNMKDHICPVRAIVSAQSMEYYDRAVMSLQTDISLTDYGLNDLYVVLLSTVLSFLGNKVTSAVYLQIFLQIISLVLVYAVTRKLARRLSACVAFLYLACSLCCLDMLTYFGPEWIYFILYMFVMLAAVSFVKSYCADDISRPLAICGAVAMGVLIGVLAYFDLTGFSLLTVMIIAAVGKKTESEATVYYNYSKGMNAAVIVSSCVSGVAVWNGAMYAASYVKGTRFIADVTDRLWVSYRYSDPFTNIQPYFLDVYIIGLLIVPASFLIFEFFRSGKEQNYMPWIILCLVVAPTPLAMSGEHGFVVLSLYIWAVLAGLGLQNCIFGGRAKVMQAVIEEINTAAERTEDSVSTEQIPETQIYGTAGNQAPRPRFIENPLPLPKKHVAREMDYQYDVADKDMKYDLFVSDNDDFDIK